MFRERIKTSYYDLSPSFQRLADYLVDHPYEAAFMTATQLGRELELDTATVVRFAQRLDYPGFPELIDEVRGEVKERLVEYFQPPSPADVEQDAFRDAIRQDKKNIEQFELTLTQSTVDQVLAMINGAKRIVVIGEGLSRALADQLAYELHKFHFNAHSMRTEASVAAAELRVVGPEDLVIAIAESQWCPDVTGTLEVARDRGAQTIGLVGAQSWPVARASHVSVLCPTASNGVPSLVTIHLAINAILQSLFFERRERLVNEILGFEDAMRQLMAARSEVDIAPLITEGDKAPEAV